MFSKLKKVSSLPQTQSLKMHNKYNAGNVVIGLDLDPSVLLLAFVLHILCDETVQFLHVEVRTANWLSASKLQCFLVICEGGKKAILDAFL